MPVILGAVLALRPGCRCRMLDRRPPVPDPAATACPAAGESLPTTPMQRLVRWSLDLGAATDDCGRGRRRLVRPDRVRQR